MIVILGSKKYIVNWEYVHFPDGPESKPTTVCTISEFTAAGPNELAQGIVRCHPNDEFIKDEGRKKSLARALEATVPDLTNRSGPFSGPWNRLFNKEDRRNVWNEYFVVTANPVNESCLVINPKALQAAIRKFAGNQTNLDSEAAQETLCNAIQNMGRIRV